MKKRLLLAICSAGLALPAAAWETAGFYSAKNKLIRPGMTMEEVQHDAGEPLERKGPKSGKPKKSNSKRTSDNFNKTKSKAAPKIEVWTYRRPDGLYSLIFGGGRLSKIDVTPARDL